MILYRIIFLVVIRLRRVKILNFSNYIRSIASFVVIYWYFIQLWFGWRLSPCICLNVYLLILRDSFPFITFFILLQANVIFLIIFINERLVCKEDILTILNDLTLFQLRLTLWILHGIFHDDPIGYLHICSHLQILIE